MKTLRKHGYGLMVALALTVFAAGPISPIVSGGTDVVITNGFGEGGGAAKIMNPNGFGEGGGAAK